MPESAISPTDAKAPAATPRYELVHMADIPGVPCPCGTAKRAFTDDPDQLASFHITEISADSRTHYHKRLTEIYYVLEGKGVMELDGDQQPIKPGDAIMIKPGCRHRAIGRLKLVIVAMPVFDPADEWFD